jgi:hypothetical protein
MSFIFTAFTWKLLAVLEGSGEKPSGKPEMESTHGILPWW